MSEKSDNNAGVNIGISKANAKAALSESDLNALMNMNGATLTELRVNKAEQYVFFLSKVRNVTSVIFNVSLHVETDPVLCFLHHQCTF